MTLTELARAYYSEGSRGHPVCQRQKERLFLNDLRFGNGRFKPLKSLLKRMGWREERPLNRRQLALIIQFFSVYSHLFPLCAERLHRQCVFLQRERFVTGPPDEDGHHGIVAVRNVALPKIYKMFSHAGTRIVSP